jgi:hypothetical protein
MAQVWPGTFPQNTAIDPTEPRNRRNRMREWCDVLNATCIRARRLAGDTRDIVVAVRPSHGETGDADAMNL